MTVAKIVKQSDTIVDIEMKGKSEVEIEKDIQALQKALQSSNSQFVLQSVLKSGNTFMIRFMIEKSPAEQILEILKQYEEGTMPRDGSYED